ncbi:winged helix-turn-helix domain-containing protein [Actinacidiphila glaucinigra]|uniref:winged helix-turn-helix domain-containing protein n=1 Tax=Actinacidiphila glaucinigra TaxID=235986 RepID=UPI0035D73438
MRYAQGGGLTAERRAFREQIRLDAGEMFAAGSDNAEVAKVLRVHVRSVQCWRHEWAERGEAGLVAKGPASLPKLSDELFVKLEAALELGAVAHGWSDERWTLARIRTLIGRMFHKSYTAPGVCLLLHRHGWSPQIPARRAVQRDDEAVATWVKETWPAVEPPRRHSAPGPSSPTRPGSR